MDRDFLLLLLLLLLSRQRIRKSDGVRSAVHGRGWSLGANEDPEKDETKKEADKDGDKRTAKDYAS